MTTELLDERIKKYNEEMVLLENRHQSMLMQVTNNQNRFQQIKGAIAELMELKKQLNGSTPT